MHGPAMACMTPQHSHLVLYQHCAGAVLRPPAFRRLAVGHIPCLLNVVQSVCATQYWVGMHRVYAGYQQDMPCGRRRSTWRRPAACRWPCATSGVRRSCRPATRPGTWGFPTALRASVRPAGAVVRLAGARHLVDLLELSCWSAHSNVSLIKPHACLPRACRALVPLYLCVIACHLTRKSVCSVSCVMHLISCATGLCERCSRHSPDPL